MLFILIGPIPIILPTSWVHKIRARRQQKKLLKQQQRLNYY